MCKRSEWSWVSWVLAAAAVVIYPSPLLQQWLEYDRQSLAAGQLWRIVTCHWTHWSVEHLIWDVSMFALLAAACERWSRRATAITLASSALLIPIVLWVAQPGLGSYRGLSGLDSAVFGLLAVHGIANSLTHRRWSQMFAAVLLVIAFAGKVGYESVAGGAVFVQTGGFSPVPLAHAVGATVGLVVGILFHAAERPVRQPFERAMVTTIC